MKTISKYFLVFFISISSLAWSSEEEEMFEFTYSFPPNFIYEIGDQKNLESFDSNNLYFSLSKEENESELISIFQDQENCKYIWLENTKPSIEELVNDKIILNNYYRENYISRQNSFPPFLTWLVYEKNTNKLVGMLSIDPVSTEEVNTETYQGFFKIAEIKSSPHVNFARIVIPGMQKRGFGTEMASTLIKILFQYTNTEKIISCSFLHNIAPQKTIESLRDTFSITKKTNSSYCLYTIQRAN